MNPMALVKIKGLFDRFRGNHPKVFMFAKDAIRQVDEGTIIEVNITTRQGKNMCTNMKLSAEDMELFEQLKQIIKDK